MCGEDIAGDLENVNDVITDPPFKGVALLLHKFWIPEYLNCTR